MAKDHLYAATIRWTGNTGEGTRSYTGYERSHTISVDRKPDISGSSDPAFRGDPSKHNPEDLLVSSLSACHMLWFLHLCADAGISVLEYSDQATGTMRETDTTGGHFTEVVLRPQVVVENSAHIERANELHEKANKLCFIANSCNFPVRHLPSCKARQ